MTTFLLYLPLASIFALIVGLVRPTRVVGFLKQPSRLKVVGVYLPITLLLLAISGSQMDPYDIAQPAFERGDWDTAIRNFDRVEPAAEHYDSAQARLSRARDSARVQSIRATERAIALGDWKAARKAVARIPSDVADRPRLDIAIEQGTERAKLETAQPDPEEATPEPAPEENAKPTFSPVKLRETLHIGDMGYLVHEIQFRKRIGNDFYDATADGVYLATVVSVLNNANRTTTFGPAAFELEDAAGNRYDYSERAMATAEMAGMKMLDYDQAHPGVQTGGVLIFEVPKRGKGYKLVIDDGSLPREQRTILLN